MAARLLAQLLRRIVVAEGFRIDAAWLDALDRYVEGLAHDTAEAASVTAHALHDAAVDRAREHPEWVNLADHIEMWSQDGHLRIGVHHQAMTSQASIVEYGDESRPPAPLLRTMNRLVPQAQDRFTRELQARRGPVRIKGVKL